MILEKMMGWYLLVYKCFSSYRDVDIAVIIDKI